jgi:hypothetical protein
MPLTMLHAFNELQLAILMGLLCYLASQGIPVRVMRQLPMIQRRLRKRSAIRVRVNDILTGVVVSVTAVLTLLVLAVAGLNVYATAVARNPRLATLADLNDAIAQTFPALAVQIVFLAMFFIYDWRGRRSLRAMAREELAALGAASAAGEASAPAGS